MDVGPVKSNGVPPNFPLRSSFVYHRHTHYLASLTGRSKDSSKHKNSSSTHSDANECNDSSPWSHAMTASASWTLPPQLAPSQNSQRSLHRRNLFILLDLRNSTQPNTQRILSTGQSPRHLHLWYPVDQRGSLVVRLLNHQRHHTLQFRHPHSRFCTSHLSPRTRCSISQPSNDVTSRKRFSGSRLQ